MKIFYNPKMVVSDLESEARSAGKPKLFVGQVTTTDIGTQII
jgi:hypothetical protein